MNAYNKFRPQDLPKSFIFKQRLKHSGSENYNWQTRVRWYPAGWQPNQLSIGRRFSRLHYLACHAPAAVQKKWRPAYQAFERKHFGNLGRASMRYLNTWSCHSWL
jgi:hypothetical protein